LYERQPPVSLYDILAVPPFIPVTTPVTEFTEAMLVLPLNQLPPEAELV
jgi:hypothetical protein